jgi:hypothetical protein
MMFRPRFVIGMTPIQDLPSAPIIFFEFCPTLGNNNGLINIMLAAGRVMPTSGPGTETVPVAVAHLRCTTAAAIQLREAIGKALLLGAAFELPQVPGQLMKFRAISLIRACPAT